MSRVAIGLLLGLTLSAAACDRQTPPPGQANETAGAAAAPDTASPDEVSPDEAAPGDAAAALPAGAVDRSHRGEAAPTLAFRDPAGKKTSLAAFRGTPVLLNLWATWCAPCIKELPSLDAAARANAGKLTVLAVSQDIDAGKAAPFLAARNVAALVPYADPEMGLSLAYRVNLPTTILFDAQGRELWRVSGAFEWDGAAARALLAERS